MMNYRNHWWFLLSLPATWVFLIFTVVAIGRISLSGPLLALVVVVCPPVALLLLLRQRKRGPK